MKILFVNPDLGGPYKDSSIYMPPIGLLYVATVARDAGHEVRVIDVAVDGSPSDAQIADADLVGIGCLSSQFNYALGLAERAKAAGKIVVMGGPHPTFQAEEILSTGLADYIVRAEGEYKFRELAAAIEQNGRRLDPSNILGISWRDAEGHVRHNPPRPFIENIDELPVPDRGLLNIEAYKATKLEKTHSATTLVTSRGCPFDCSFCVSTRMTGRRWRWRSAESVVDEVQMLRDRYGFTGVFFVDDNLSVDIARIERLCSMMIERKLGMRWWCMSRADTIVRNERVVARMAQAGCGTIFLGLESASDDVLKTFNKKSTTDTGARAVRILHKHGIRSQGSFILGAPEEKIRDMRRTIEFAKRLNPKVGQFSLLTPFPGSALWDRLADRIDTRDWSRFDCIHAVYRSDNASVATRERMWKTAYREYYMRPRYILAHWRTINFQKTFSLLSGMFKRRRKSGPVST